MIPNKTHIDEGDRVLRFAGMLDRIAFYGPMASGKSWCAEYLFEQAGFKKFAFAGKLKSIAKELFEVTGKDGKDRVVLQKLGEYMRLIDDDVWVNYCLRDIAAYEDSPQRSRVVIDDLRYENEALALRQNGFYLIKLDCPEEIRQERIKKLYPNFVESSAQHSSEQGWKNIVPDLVLESSGVGARHRLNQIISYNI